jgi:hypothetical protein
LGADSQVFLLRGTEEIDLGLGSGGYVQGDIGDYSYRADGWDMNGNVSRI